MQWEGCRQSAYECCAEFYMVICIALEDKTLKYTDTSNGQLESALSGVVDKGKRLNQPAEFVVGHNSGNQLQQEKEKQPVRSEEETIEPDLPEMQIIEVEPPEENISDLESRTEPSKEDITDMESQTEAEERKEKDGVEQPSVQIQEPENRKVVIEVKNLYKIYKVGSNRVRALNGVDFQVYEGEFCAIVGTSGSGKSTLLNMLAGLEKPTKGEIIIAGQHIEKMNEKKLVRFRRENVGFIFQSFNLIGTLNALENVALPLSFRGIPKPVRLRKAMKLLKLVGLKAHAKHKPNQMSGGQQQRVGMARALVVDPKIMFADEPTGNLDSRTSKDMMALMRKVVNEHKKTLVMVTHDNSLAAIADKVIRIVDGKIVDIEDRTKVVEDKEL